jgi:hypothetical protein
LRDGGGLGLLATNTIAQGDTREVGLDQLVSAGFAITRAVPSRPWPGTANLEVAHVWLRKGEWKSEHVLDEKPAAGITSYLARPGTVSGKPYRLAANEGKSFQGSIVLGMGFVLTPEEAQSLIDKNPKNREVLFPYLNGQDLNSRPDQSPSRWVINFRDWPLDRPTAPKEYTGPVAADYPDCLVIVEAKVKPEREKSKRKVRRERWWQFAERAPALYAAIEGMERVLVRARIANVHSICWVPDGWVYNEKTVVFAGVSFALLQSCLHECWARAYSSTLRKDMQYTPSDCFETFPLVDLSPSAINEGERYEQLRATVMLQTNLGLTATYNRVNDPSATRGHGQLRQAHARLDRAVLEAYGWGDISLEHGFQNTPQGTRFTISDRARRDVLDRLLALNHERHAEEVRQGLHQAESARKASSKSRKKGRASDDSPVPPRVAQTGFGFADDSPPDLGARRSVRRRA